MTRRRIALVLAGQGAEEPGMGLALARVDARAARYLAVASEAAEIDLVRALDRGGRVMARTEAIQPALVAVGLAAARALEERGVEIAMVAGHSLGELAAAGFALGADEPVIELAALRGRLMAEAVAARPGGMLAAFGADDESITPALELGLALAAHNAPDERVLSGDPDALARAEKALMVRTRRLAVAGPWHAPAMQPAVAPFASALRERLGTARLSHATRLFSAVTGARVESTDSACDVLATGLARPVRWVDTLRALRDAGATDVVAIAPSRVGRSLVRRTLGDTVAIFGVDGPDDLDALS